MPSLVLESQLQELFFDLHSSGLFDDGKEISDAILHTDPALLLREYRAKSVNPGFDLRAFFAKHFSKSDSERTVYQTDPQHNILEHIQALWPVLSRVGKSEDGKTWSSKINLPHPYIVPGGRFDEIYYWDSYFTMLGLRVAGEFELMQGMIDNFSYLIEQYGFIPNGNRTYYLGRSQPPFFALMVRLLGDSTEKNRMVKYLPALIIEYQFWMNIPTDGSTRRNIMLSDGEYLNRYFDDAATPRTEMYSDDVELIQKAGAKGQKLVTEIRAACESGWDFSSRWLADPYKLESICTTDIIPVDLNCLIYGLETTIAELLEVQNEDSAEKYRLAAADRARRINTYCWNDIKGCYYDYNHMTQKQTEVLSAATVYPLFFKVATQEQADKVAVRLETNLLKAGGLVSTEIETGQQWDSPNGWAPQQWMAYIGLMNYGHQVLANKLKNRWLALNEKTFAATGKMMEKYNVVNLNLESGGGEYPVQDGFGWTNGVYLAMKNQIADRD